MFDKPGGALSKSKMVCDSLCHSQHLSNKQLKAGLFQQVGDFFSKIFSTADWPPRWRCGTWSDFHGWLYIASDISIWAAYFAIPFLLFRIINNRKDIPFPKIFWLFIAFILLCGASHLVDALIFWWPAYRLSALVRLATGIVSIFTVFALYKILPQINKLRTVEQLEAEIEDRKKAEQDAKHQQVLKLAAEDLMAKKDEFMSIASHELKTPITSIKASLQLLQRMTEKNNALEPAAPFVNKAAKQVNKLTALVNDLLDVTRIQAGRLELVKTEFNLAQLVNETVEYCQTEENKHQVEVTGDAELLVTADRKRIDQVLANFLTNAFKFSPENEPVLVSFQKINGSKVKVSVADKGIGIPPDKVENIFDRFYRVENTSQSYSGIGLGLYISSEVIKRHQGEIGVESAVGAGSTFWFTL
jgi:signal transduction histidine kinase